MKNEPTFERTDAENTTTDSTAQFVATDANSDKIPGRFLHGKSGKFADGIDSDLITKTKNQIRSLVSEIAELSRTATDRTDFFRGFLIRTTSALASEGGAVWLADEKNQPLELVYHVNMEQISLATDPVAQSRHSQLLNKIREENEPTLIPPNSGTADIAEAGNPTDKLLLFGPLVVNNQTVGLVEIFQRPGAGPTTQRGYLRFLAQMCEIASDFLKDSKLQNFGQQQALWQQLDSFVKSIHNGLDPDQIAYVLANESRRIIGCDRVSVVLNKSGRWQIQAVSGLDSIERRADQIKKLQTLTRAVIKGQKPLWYSGDDQNLSPQIEKRLHEYIDKSHTKMIAVLPLKKPTDSSTSETKQNSNVKPIGALIVEQLKDSTIDGPLKRRVEVICDHSESALANAVEHNSLFLLPLWKTIGKMLQPFSAAQLPKTVTILSVLAGIIAFFVLFPYPFTLSSNGQLKPQIQNEVYARIGGILQEVYVQENDGERVKQNDVLARMSNNDLDVQIQNLEGKINQTNEQIRKFRSAQSQRLERYDSIMLDGELRNSEEELASLNRELELKKKQANELLVRSPADGFVVNWQVRKNLLKRPVDRGQNLMTVVDPDGGWQLELEIPERRLGHLLKCTRENDEPLKVSFALVSHPGKEFKGELTQVDEKLQVYGDDGNCAKAIVSFYNDQIPADLLKSGTRVNAKLQCGTRSIGYVWFHELFETVQMTYKYWF